jgi:hypothetical protein
VGLDPSFGKKTIIHGTGLTYVIDAVQLIPLKNIDWLKLKEFNYSKMKTV